MKKYNKGNKGMKNTGPLYTTYNIDMMVVLVVVVKNFSIHFYLILLYLIKNKLT